MISGQVARAVLAGGRSPARHRQELIRAAAQLDFSRRASAWIAELVGTRPMLSGEPLYGRCLPELATAFSAPAGSREEVKPRLRAIGERRNEEPSRAAQPSSRQPSTCSSDCPPSKSSSTSPSRRDKAQGIAEAGDLDRVPLRAEASLLRRLGGEPDSLRTLNTPRLRRPLPFPAASNERLPFFSQSLAREKEWRAGVAERVAAVLRGPTNNLFETRSSRHIAAPHTNRREERSAAERENSEAGALSDESRPFADGWSKDVAGQGAPADLLRRLARARPSKNLEAHRTDRPAQPGSMGEGGSSEIGGPPRPFGIAPMTAGPGFGADTIPQDGADRPALPGFVGEGGSSEIAGPPPSFGIARVTSVPGPGADTILEEEHRPLPDSARFPERSRYFPESILSGAENIPVAPSLPAMLVTESTRHPEPNIAAAIVRQGVRAEEIAQPERPEALAERIRQILQEEARRHGIDV